jgi:uncharacterized membrane protein YGL010W
MSTTATLPARLNDYFKDYAAYHKTRGNQLCHYVGIPVITATTLGLFGSLTVAGGLTGSEYVRLDGGTILMAAAVVWYLMLDWRIAAPFTLFAVGLYFIGRAIPVPALWTLFILGWVVQYIGHYVYEKKSPAFYKNLTHLLIGPLWIFSKWIGYAR